MAVARRVGVCEDAHKLYMPQTVILVCNDLNIACIVFGLPVVLFGSDISKF